MSKTAKRAAGVAGGLLEAISFVLTFERDEKDVLQRVTSGPLVVWSRARRDARRKRRAERRAAEGK